ncbi:Serine/threonine-protein kinase Nek10 [Channa argus]|uniref:Serine/threonine-protein kinase Nek10 n=1 Tax=Channa argus TaxID=215402 RepID=A0A6G1PPU9_CHAAH|nr:Serine/threonine-protein kinase Nek10 [Channa argus]
MGLLKMSNFKRSRQVEKLPFKSTGIQSKASHDLRRLQTLLVKSNPRQEYMESVTAMYISCGEQAFAVQKLVTMTYMFQKLSAVENQRVWVIECGAHKTMVKLLSTTDSSVLLGALLALTTLAESPECKEEIGKLPIAENLLVILQEYDLLSKRMSAELLRLLSPVRRVREQVRELEGLPMLLSLLHGQHLKLLWSIAWVLVQLCEDPETRTEIRSWGGVQQLLRLLSSDRQYVSDRSSIEILSSANAAGRIQREHIGEALSPQEEVDNTMALQSACCTALTELSLDDTSAHQIVQENGVYIIAKLTLPQTLEAKVTSLQCYAFRTLRFLFSVERNRHLFKRLFPTDLFELFIDVGHYVRDLAAYERLQTKVSLYTEEELDSLRDSIKAVDQNRPPLKITNGYSILDHLGTGAFGSVFKMCLALRYLHKEKRIVHRDLTPNNIMLGERDKVTITDFGLAKQKQESSKLTSVVGTILYSCPEVVKNEPYGEKADIWALGCILYQMATLKPPFYSSNMLSLASKIVEAVYEPIEEGAFSERVTDMIRWCLSPDADQRPDIVAISSRISDLMMKLIDGLYTSQNALERRAERDRKRAQKYFLERHKHWTNCCQSNLSEMRPQMMTLNLLIRNTTVLTLQKNTTLPPASHNNIKRRVVEKFKKSLFHHGSDPYSLKVELSKLFQASPDLMELSLTSSDWWPMTHHFTGDPQAADRTGDDNLKDGVTYQQMQGIIEELLEENSYYGLTHSRVTEKRNDDKKK